MEFYLFWGKGTPSTSRVRGLLCLFLACVIPTLTFGDTRGPNLFPAGSFENMVPAYVPWAGVDSQNNLHGLPGRQLMVSDAGIVGGGAFGPSVATADLNGDGKVDLVMADSRGFFWYYPNSGTPQKAAFTQGEVIPIWLGEERIDPRTEGVDSVVPRIQLVSFDGSGKLDVAAGTFAGKLFRIPNIGSTGQPNFKPTQNRDSLLINTHRRGQLWCNYLAPFFTTAFGSPNSLDVVMGEGTYSANSIYLLHNTGSSSQPSFDENHIQKIIPGMGLEHLTPVVIDWNNDGKPDILFGDRTGYVNLCLNNSSDPANPTFAPAVRVKIGGIEKLGDVITVTVADLSNNHLPNLIIGRDDGTLLYAVNTGKLGSPQFSTPATQIKGVLPPDYHYLSPTNWSKYGAWGVPYEMVSCTNPQVEPGFKFPDGEKSKYALKFSVWPYQNKFFQRYYLPEETQWNEHVVLPSQGLPLKLGARYHVHFWVLAPGSSVNDFRFYLHPHWTGSQGWHPELIENTIASTSSWSEASYDIRTPSDPTGQLKVWTFVPEFHFYGQSTFYLDDLTIQESL